MDILGALSQNFEKITQINIFLYCDDSNKADVFNINNGCDEKHQIICISVFSS